ncbi:alpha/beta fold hydrolase [Nocardioides endophyticus]|uniref:Alpha/beta fold hydrolase n=1 Tax=Nocardioides endophyticus TaxID=1353775 RepID=A0ABP8ZC18_9ACTN
MTDPRPTSYVGTAGTLIGEVRRPAGDSRGLVVLLHGGGQTRHSWSRAAESLCATGWTTLTYDARGHGDSAWAADGAYDLQLYVDDLERVLEQAGEGTAEAVVGASLGGMTGLMLLDRTPAAARSLVLVDITPRPRPAGVMRIKEFMSANPEGFATLDDVAAAVSGYRTDDPPRDPERLRRSVRQRPDGRWRWHWDPAILPAGPEEDDPIIHPEDVIAAASRVRVPTLLVAGGSSDVVSGDEIRELLDVMPVARAVVLDGASHMVVGDRNDAFLREIHTFLGD